MKMTKQLLETKISELGTVEEVARYFGMSKSRIYVLAHRLDVQTSGQKKVDVSKDVLIKAVKEQKTVSQIADELQVANSTVRRRMAEYGIIAYNPQKSKQIIDREKCIELLKAGKSNEDIATEFDCHVDTVKNFIGNHNLRGFRKKRNIKEIIKAKSNLTGEEGVLCANNLICKTKQKCFYGGKCGGYDCCDYLLMTGKMRKHDNDNSQLCFCYVYASKAEKMEIAAQKINADRDVLIT